MTCEAWLQTTLGIGAGGLGLREAAEIALSTFVASRVASTLLVAEMAAASRLRGLALPALPQAYDFRLLQALDR